MAAGDGYDGVECHWPYDVPAMDFRKILDRHDVPILGLNTCPGNMEAGEFGLAAMPSRANEARKSIREAVEYGALVGARNLHVMAGNTSGGAESENVFRENLLFACDLAAERGMTVLVEPLNPVDHPDYHLRSFTHASDIISDLNRSNLKLMFDCYHAGHMNTWSSPSLETLIPIIGHVQIASVPDRNEPDQGEIDIAKVLGTIRDLGYEGWIGAEYRPRTGRVSDGIAWLVDFRRMLGPSYLGS